MSRTREQVIWDFVQDWLSKAKSDLLAAEHLLGLDAEDHFAAAFHAQQAAEKFIKALLVRHQIPFPKTHDIQHLLELTAEVEPEAARELERAAALTPFGVEFRYPGSEPITQESAQSAVRQAQLAQLTVMAHLEDYLVSGRPDAPG